MKTSKNGGANSESGLGPNCDKGATGHRKLADFLAHATVEFDTEGQIISASMSGLDIFGYTRKDLEKGLNIFQMIVPEHHDRAKEGLLALPKRRRLQETEYTGVRHDQTTFPIQVITSPLDTESDPSCLGAVVIDLSGLKRAESAFRKIEHTLVEAQKVARLGFWSVDMVTGSIWASEGLYGIYGVDEIHFVPTIATVVQFVHPDDRHSWNRALSDALAGKAAASLEYRVLRPDGDQRIVEAFVTGTDHDEKDKPVRLFGVVQDITERRRAHEAWRTSEDRYAKAFRASPAIIAVTSIKDGRFIEVNAAFAQFTGYDQQTVIGRTSAEIGLWDNRQERSSILRTLGDGRSVRNQECRFRRKTGHLAIGLVSAEQLNLEGEPCVQWALVDITERKAAEEELHRKSAFLEAIVNASLDGIIVSDKGKKVLQNKRLRELLKIPEVLAENDDAETQFRWFKTRVCNPAAFHSKATYIRTHQDVISRDQVDLKDGTSLDRYSSPVLGKNGEYYGRVWTFRDITEQRKVEQTLRESEERFRRVFEDGPLGMIMSGSGGRFLRVNSAFCKMLGYEEQELMSLTFRDIVHPEDIAEHVLLGTALSRGEIPVYQKEERYLRKTGETVWGSSTVCIIRSEDGLLLYFLAMVEDITHRKEADEELMEREAELEVQSLYLQESNTALKVLLKHRDEDKKTVEDTIHANVAELVLPYVEKLKASHLDSNQIVYLDMLETNLRDIVSPFLRRMTSRDKHLTPTEIQIANLIRGGKTSKEIAGLMNVSKRTIDSHRENIRSKLELFREKTNLQSYLESLDQ